MLTLLIAISLSLAIYCLGTAGAAYACGVGIFEIGLGIGPQVYRARWRTSRINIRVLPMGSIVRLKQTTLEPCEDDAEQIEMNAVPGRNYNDLPAFGKLFILCSGPILMFLIAFLFLGNGAVASARDSLVEAYKIILSPSVMGLDVITKAANFISSEPIHLTFANILAKLALLNLIPIPSLNGWFIFSEVVLLGRKFPRFQRAMQYCGLLIAIACYFRVASAIYYYVKS